MHVTQHASLVSTKQEMERLCQQDQSTIILTKEREKIPENTGLKHPKLCQKSDEPSSSPCLRRKCFTYKVDQLNHQLNKC